MTQSIISFLGRIDKGEEYIQDEDSPVKHVANIIKQHGISGLKMMHGDFVVSYVSIANNQIYLYRSEFGGKKLAYYYHPKIKSVLWGTSISQIVNNNFTSQMVKEEYIATYVSKPFNNRRRMTPYSDVYHVIPGECIEISRKGIKTVFTKDFNYDRNVSKLDEKEQIRLFTELFTKSVHNRLNRCSDTVNLFLSGGFDSSTIAYVANDLIRERNLNCKLMYQHTDHMRDGSEIEFAQKVANDTSWEIQVTKSDHNNPILSGFHPDKKIDLCEPSPLMLGSLDFHEDFYDQTSNVTLSGIGGDQVINGNKYTLWSLLNERKYIDFVKGVRTEGIINAYRDHWYEPLQIYKNSFFDDEMFRGLFTQQFIKKWDLHHNAKIHELPRIYPLPRQIEYEEIMMFHQNIPLEGMHHMDARHPFLDYDLVNFCFSLPVNMKRNETTKVILRKSFANYFSQHHLGRGKSDHSTQIVHDINKKQEKLNILMKHSRLVELGIVEYRQYQKLLGYLQYGTLEKPFEFMKIIELDVWLIMKDVRDVI